MRDSVMVVGGGMMGSGIAAVSALAGNPTILVESSSSACEKCPERVDGVLAELERYELISPEERLQAMARMRFEESYEDLCGEVFFVIEAIVEKLEAKQALFADLDARLPQEVPIVSNTSGLRITEITSLVRHPERTATAHFWFPAHLVPLVEVVMSESTSPDIASWVVDTLKAWGKAPVLVRRDLPGQLANRILQAVIREASNIVEIGLASPEDVDTAVKMGMGIRLPVWGPLEHVDAVGVDLCNAVQKTVLPGISDSHEANATFKKLVADGNLGYKTGKGFYDWKVKDMTALATLRNEFIVHALKKIKPRK